MNDRGTTSSNGCAIIFVYMTYTMLPVRLREALFGGFLLSSAHIYLSIKSSRIDWQEVKHQLVNSQTHKPKKKQN